MSVIKAFFRKAVSQNGAAVGYERTRREIILFVSGFASFVALVSFFLDVQVAHKQLPAVSNVLVLFAGLLLGVPVLFAKRMPGHTVGWLGLLATFAILLGDLYARTKSDSNWPIFVIIIDFLLITRAPRRYTVAAVVVVTTWIVVNVLESSLRLGLYDLPGTSPQSVRREMWEEKGDCAELPCKVEASAAVVYGLTGLLIFLVDFVTTRGFAHQAMEEQARMAQTIRIVEEIATQLASYDVETVAVLLDHNEGTLPHQLNSALRALEVNLRIYKPYLPTTCLPLTCVRERVSESDKPKEGDSTDDHTPDIDGTWSGGSTLSHAAGSSLSLGRFTRKVNPLALKSAVASMLLVNVKDTMGFLDNAADVEQFSSLFTALMLATLKSVETYGGMVDVFVGDKVYSSFNASKVCRTHAIAALSAAQRMCAPLREHGLDIRKHINMGAATGTVLRGEMGCPTFRRFRLLGSLMFDVRGLERAGSVLKIQVLASYPTFVEAECAHALRLVPRFIQVRGQNLRVAELLPSRNAHCTESSEGTAVEWIYAVGETAQEWGAYNAAVKEYLKGGLVGDILKIAGDKTEALSTNLNAIGSELPLRVNIDAMT